MRKGKHDIKETDKIIYTIVYRKIESALDKWKKNGT